MQHHKEEAHGLQPADLTPTEPTKRTRPMDSNQYSNGYLFTKKQAAKVARDLIVTHHEGNGPASQDDERLAVRIAHLLGIMPNTQAVENALNLLDELAAVERGNHDMLILDPLGIADNTAEVIEYFESHLTEAIDEVVARFSDHWELAA
jgi:hypothetical protein